MTLSTPPSTSLSPPTRTAVSTPLRLLDDKTFQEIRPEAERKRSREWRRSFNFLSFTATRATVSRLYTVNEIDHLPEAPSANPVAEPGKTMVFGALRRQARITARVPQDAVRDTLYFARERGATSGEFLLERAKGDIELVITEGPPTEERGPFADGAYGGLAFRSRRDPADDHLSIDVAIPSEFMTEIVANLERDGRQALGVGIEVESFSTEVEDGRGQWNQPRDLFLHGIAVPAALVSLRVSPVAPASGSDESASLRKAAPLQQPAAQPPAAPAASSQLEQILAGARLALWVIAALLAVHLLSVLR
jgi:hypothetical protein